MPRDFLGHVGRLTPGRLLMLGLFCAVALEAVTAICRFGLGLEATRQTVALGAYTFGMRIHHGYFGLLLAPFALCLRHRPARNLLLIFAIGLVVSDLCHHFLVLWPLTGSPHLDIFYPIPQQGQPGP